MNRNPKNKKNHKIWKQYKDHHTTEGCTLIDVFEIYLPFWQCKQNVVIEKDVELDRFSQIILELINNKITNHAEICAFLGIDEDSFVIMQFYFLLKNDFIREVGSDGYEITHEGLAFLQNKTKVKNIDTVDFEYFVTERMSYLKNELTQDFFDPNLPIDRDNSKGKKRSFSGYTIMQTHQIKQSDISKIPHKDRPTFRTISKNRVDFSTFFNERFNSKIFYDFADKDMEAHKRNICFHGLLYEKESNNEESILDIRQSRKSVKKFSGANLERRLTEKVNKYLQENPNFLTNQP